MVTKSKISLKGSGMRVLSGSSHVPGTPAQGRRPGSSNSDSRGAASTVHTAVLSMICETLLDDLVSVG